MQLFSGLDIGFGLIDFFSDNPISGIDQVLQKCDVRFQNESPSGVLQIGNKVPVHPVPVSIF
jgi:hypothetical protein